MKNCILSDALKDEQFRSTYDYGIERGMIVPFSTSFMSEMKDYYIPFTNTSLYDYFKNGDNIGFCLEACNHLAEMFDRYEIHKGILPAIKGTKRSPRGEHAWLVSDGMIYDTSLLLIIDSSLSDLLGYNSEGIVKTNVKYKRN